MIRFASTGNESTGKSAVLNAVFRTRFRVDARARSTAFPARETVRHGNSEIEVIDSPPLTMRVGKLEADAYLLVCDKDLTEPEYEEALRICRAGRALGVVLNKIDTYSTRTVWSCCGTYRRGCTDTCLVFELSNARPIQCVSCISSVRTEQRSRPSCHGARHTRA